MSRNGKHKACSAGGQLQQRSPDELKQTKKSKIRQSSAQVTKQYQAKQIQNFTFNQPGKIFLHTFLKRLRYYATFKVRKLESLFYKPNTCLQKTTTCIGLQVEQIFL